VAVSNDDVRRIAALARIAIPDARLDAMARDLSGILAQMDALSRVDQSGVAAGEASPGGMRLAGDAGPPVSLERAREDFAPDYREGFFIVPRLSTHESAGEA
jgi:aspartyl-tRNA(Asn)/glutamyl-tRNA(Gln) amidotransferase subunit C